MDVVAKLPATATATATATVTVTVATAAPPSSSAVRLLVLVACWCLFSGVLVASNKQCVFYLGGILCCVAFQAAATRLALLLPSRRRRLRHGVAFVALAAASLGNCLFAAVIRLVLAADPEYLFYRICCSLFIVVLGVGDILSFIALLLLGGEN